jgi:hypothetical protein
MTSGLNPGLPMRAAQLALLLCCAAHTAFCAETGVGTAFTYQGRLTENGAPVQGSYDARFTLFNAPIEGEQIGTSTTNSAVALSNGLFTVVLDFGGVFDGTSLWLSVGVRPSGGGEFTELSPRQALTATPYAVRAANVATFTGAVSDEQLSANVARLDANQVFNGTVTFNSQSNNFAGSFVGDGAAISNLNQANVVLNVPKLQQITNFQTVELCDSNIAFVSGATRAFSNSTSVDATAANGTYYPYAPNCLTNANGIYWFLAPTNDLDFGGPQPYWVITPDTNPPVVEHFWYYSQDPCDEKSGWGNSFWSDYDGTSYLNLGLWATNYQTNLSYTPYFTNVAFSSDRAAAINARDWGAKGDGTTDDRPVIGALFNYITSPGATNVNVYFPPGTYYVPGGLPALRNHPVGHTISGAGPSLTVFQCGTATNITGFGMGAVFGTGQNCIRGFTMLGPQQDGLVHDEDNSIGILFDQGSLDKLEDVSIRGFARGILFVNCWHCLVQECDVRYMSKTGYEGYSSHMTLLKQCVFVGSHSGVSSHRYVDRGVAFEGTSGDDATVLNCDVSCCTNAFWNNGDVGLHVVSSHIEWFRSVYSCTNLTRATSHFEDCYLLVNSPDFTVGAFFNVDSWAAQKLVLDSIHVDPSSWYYDMVQITDINTNGYHPPQWIAGNGQGAMVRYINGGVTNSYTIYSAAGSGKPEDILHGDATWRPQTLGVGGICWSTNNTPPADTITVRGWLAITNQLGKVCKVPVYE